MLCYMSDDQFFSLGMNTQMGASVVLIFCFKNLREVLIDETSTLFIWGLITCRGLKFHRV